MRALEQDEDSYLVFCYANNLGNSGAQSYSTFFPDYGFCLLMRSGPRSFAHLATPTPGATYIAHGEATSAVPVHA